MTAFPITKNHRQLATHVTVPNKEHWGGGSCVCMVGSATVMPVDHWKNIRIGDREFDRLEPIGAGRDFHGFGY